MHSQPLNAFWNIQWLKPLNDAQAWNRLVQTINPLWSLTEIRAKVLRVVWECSDVFSLYLKPNHLFKGFTPGQHIALQLELDGARKARYFSLSNAVQANGELRLSIKINPNGSVSKAASLLKPGQIVRISQASGSFASGPIERPVLLISAGSGITPMLSLLHSWSQLTDKPNVVLVHSCQSAEQLILAKELQTLVHSWPELQVHTHFSAEHGRMSIEQLSRLVPDMATRKTYLCGPVPFMAMIESHFAQQGWSAQLEQEYFGQLSFSADPNAEQFTVFNAEAEASFDAKNGQSLLEAAESAGLKPKHGCRRGICMSCQCKKISGVVMNQLTQIASSNDEEWIQLCVSTPLSNLQLEH
jgi:stearoyl-CoA 9-desaturase NADPH oxidoreductase